MRVLLTGHQGYLGTLGRRMLAAAGHEVTGLDSGLYADCILGELERPDPPALAVDLRDVTVEALRGFDAVIHLAALSNDPLGSLAPEHTYDINHHASTRLARLAKEAGVGRFVYASTCSVYGASGTDDILDENAPMKPVTPYAESKVRVEGDLVDLADADFVPVVDAQRHRVRVLAAAARRHRAQQPRRARGALRDHQGHERRHPVAPALPRPRHRLGRDRRDGGAGRRRARRRRSTSGAPRTTCRSATSPRRSRSSSPRPSCS